MVSLRDTPIAAAFVGLFLIGVANTAVATEIEFMRFSKGSLKSSVKAIGQSLERGRLAQVLEAGQLRREFLILSHRLSNRLGPKPMELRCRYSPAPRKQRRLNLDHVVEVRLDVPLDLRVRDARVSLGVDRGGDDEQKATVFFSFSF